MQDLIWMQMKTMKNEKMKGQMKVQVQTLVVCIILLLGSYDHQRGYGLRLYSKAFNQPAAAKITSSQIQTRGEDAWFTLPNELGVFDGVGDWAQWGVDAGAYARRLAILSSSLIEVERIGGNTDINLYDMLSFAARENQQNKVVGSSTACMASLDTESSVLKVLNLGDSGALVLRPYPCGDPQKSSYKCKVLFQSMPQYHSYNAPYQIGFNFTRTSNTTYTYVKFDDPRSAVLCDIPVQDRDICIIASDGLFDNIFLSDIISIVEESCNHVVDQFGRLDVEKVVDSVTDHLAIMAPTIAVNTTARTPWSISVNVNREVLEKKVKMEQNTFGKVVGLLQNYWNKNKNGKADDRSIVGNELPGEVLGGKDDDITAIIAAITR